MNRESGDDKKMKRKRYRLNENNLKETDQNEAAEMQQEVDSKDR